MPTFLFFKGKVKVDEMSGADPKKLKEKIIKWIGDGDSDVGVKGHVSFMMLCIMIIMVSSSFIQDSVIVGKIHFNKFNSAKMHVMVFRA